MPREGVSYREGPTSPCDTLEPGSNNFSQARVLLLDDEESVVIATQALLEAHNIPVLSFTCPFELLRKLKSSQGPGLLLLDLTMPRMSGTNVQGEVARLAPYLHVLIMTGHANYSTCAEAMRLGADDIIQKPLTSPDLVPLVRRFLNSSLSKWDHYQETLRFRECFTSLSSRERDAYRLLLVGDQTKQVAFKLGISVSTAEKHVRNVLRKFHVDSSARLILFSMEHGDLVRTAESA